MGIFLLLLALWGLLQTEAGQNWLARQVTKKLSRDLQTRITIKHVKVGFFNFNKMELEGVLVEDQKQDTLLYAGQFEVRITDWFFFKDKAELKYVGLQDAVIHINRTDSVWNYAFLEKYFSSDTTSKPQSGIEFDLKKVVMKNVLFIKKDEWLGNNMTAKFDGLDLNANEITITNKTVDVSDLELTNPFFHIHNYTGRKNTENKNDDAGPADTASGSPWTIKFANVTITNGRFRNDKGMGTDILDYFDGRHIDFTGINGTLRNIGWTGSDITGNINLEAKERSGLIVKSLKANTTFSQKAMIFDDLYLETNRSIIRDYYAMSYDDIGNMNNYIHDVTMEARFSESTISSDDIAFFAPSLKTWKKNIRIDGEVRGTVDALASQDLEIWAGNNTYVQGAVSLIGLPNINQTLINIDAQDLRTTYQDAINFIPAIRNIQTPDLDKIRYLNFQGSYTGFINDFVTFGTIETNLGTLQTDLNMKFPPGRDPVYAGTLSTNGFQLGQFINSPKLGVLAFDGKISGKGFNWKTLDMEIDGTVRKIEFDNYTYQNITAKGKLANRLFNGDFIMKDPNADLSLTGLVDFTGDKPLFKVSADIAFANLRELQLTRDELRLTGRFNLDLEASSLSDMLGTARISNATLINNGKRLSFDSLMVSSTFVDGLKRLKAVSNEFDATITGDFYLNDLPDAFTLFLSRYYPSYIKPPVSVQPQIFTFDITTGIVEDYMKLIDPRLSGFNNSHITGSLNTSANTMTVDADVPHFGFKQYQFSDIQLKGSGDLEKILVTGHTANAQIGDSIFFPQTNFSVEAQNDVSDITINTTSNQAINKASLSAQVRTFSDGVSIRFNPSTFGLNSKIWTIEEGGELDFRKNRRVQGQVVLRESNQEIRLWTELSETGSSWNDLHVEWKNLNLGDLSPFISKKNRLEGIVSGKGVIEDPANNMYLTADINARELRIDNDSIGRFTGTIEYNNNTGVMIAKGQNVDPDHRIEVDIAMNFQDTSNTFQDRINTRLTNFQLKYLNRFLGGIFSDLNGYVTGNFDIIGEGSDRDFLAKARVRDASFKVNFTQVTYKIDDTEFEMRKDLIDLDNIRIRDSRNQTAIVRGNIRHKGFADMEYDIQIETESDNMELLNTTFNDNQQFYGKAYGSGEFILLGPQYDMLMDINIRASEKDSSSITLPPSRTRESGQALFMVERKYGREMIPQFTSLGTNLNYNVRIAANPLVNVEVQLDELTGDAIRGNGTGNLTITSGTTAPLAIHGRYYIDDGEYDFTFQSFLKKSFKLRKGNNYIEWNGDPYDATVRLVAYYTAEQVSFAPLANTLFSQGSGIHAGVRDDVTVVATLTGNLFQPDFSFQLEFPSSNVIYSRPEFVFSIQQIEKNPNELNKQVTYLIVFNSFAPFENTAATGFTVGEFTYNTISGLLFGQINKQLNQILSRILKNNEATLSFTGSLYNRNLIDPNAKGLRLPNQSNVNLSLGLPLFNGRAQITIGATLDVPILSDFEQRIRLFPDVTLELMVNKSGSVKATFFYRQNTDFLAGNTTGIVPRRYGASIGYGKEFDSLAELFGKEKKRKRRDSVPVVDTLDKN